MAGDPLPFAARVGQSRSALAGYREAGCRFDVALVTLDMATLIWPDDPAVKAAIPEGRRIIEELGATALIERLDEAAARPTRSSTRDAATRWEQARS